MVLDSKGGSGAETGLGRRFVGLLGLAGFRCWPVVLLPALVGTTLPFWLRPPGFSFHWLAAVEFLLAAALTFSGFALLLARSRGETAHGPGAAVTCIAAGCLLGLHLNGGLLLRPGVPRGIWIVYGLAALLSGVLYVAPPARLWRQVGGEVLVCEALGMLPVLGAYLLQAGDLTRTVYLASLPMVAAAALWVWTGEIATRADDERAGRRTMVMLFPPRLAGRVLAPGIAALWCATLVGAVWTGALSQWALAALLLSGLVWPIVNLSWRAHADPARMLAAHHWAFALYLATSAVLAASSLLAQAAGRGG